MNALRSILLPLTALAMVVGLTVTCPARASDPVDVDPSTLFLTEVEGKGWEKIVTFKFSGALERLPRRTQPLKPTRLDQAFDEFAVAAGVNLIAQHYRKAHPNGGVGHAGPPPPPLQEGFLKTPLKEIIRHLADWSGYEAVIEGDTLLLKNKTRALDDDFQLDLKRDHLVYAFRDTNSLEFQSHFASGEYTDKQRALLATELPFLSLFHPGLDVSATDNVTAASRLYHLLDRGQREKVRATAELPIPELRGDQLEVARVFLKQWEHTDPAVREKGSLRWLNYNYSHPTHAYYLDYLPDEKAERFQIDDAIPLPYGEVFPAPETTKTKTGLPEDVRISVSGNTVTAHAWAVTLGELLSAVSTTQAEKMEADSKVANRPVMIHVKRMPLPRFKALLAKVWDLRWKTAGGKAILYADEKTLAEEERLRQAARDKERQIRAERCREFHAAIDGMMDHAADGAFESDPAVAKFLKDRARDPNSQGLSPLFGWGLKVIEAAGVLSQVWDSGEVRIARSQIPAALMEQYERSVKPFLPEIPPNNRRGIPSGVEFTTLLVNRRRVDSPYSCEDELNIRLLYASPGFPDGIAGHGDGVGGGASYAYAP